MAEGYVCPACGHSGEYGEFQGHNEDLAPDLQGTGMCPQCDEFTEDLEEWCS